MKELPPAYNPKEVEGKIYRIWEKSGFFNPDNLPITKSSKLKAKSYCIAVPPPNITGSLHMGHALNAAIQDIIIRKKRMEGFKTLWLPGTDHAGIATQNVVEKELKKQGFSRHDLGREKFLEKIWEWKEKYGGIILDQFKKLGASMDWSRTRFTMDPDYQEAVKEAFLHYHKKGWIYRAKRVINWCPKDATSLSDLELEYKEEQTTLWHFKYPLADGKGFIEVATTRPETMLGDTAVAVNPKDKRYKDLVGKEAVLPIQNRKIPIIADRTIDMNFGTGAVKVTPAHDITDSEIGARHNLALKEVIDSRGRMTAEAGKICEGLKAAECRAKVVEELKSLGLLVKEEPYKHNVAVCYRCGSTIEPIPSLQWFLKMDELAKMAVKAVKSGKIKFHPKRWEKTYFEWLKNVRDWNISRQIWWGHQVPVWFHEPKCVPRKGHKGEIVKCKEFIVSVGEPECEFCDAKFVQSSDVLDTWFSSALWPFATLGWPIACAQNQKSKIKNQNNREPLRGSDLEQFYPTQVLSTARDIINLWVARMIFSALEFTGKEPFKDIIIHGTILTKEGKRMSKSLGTGVDPLDLIEKYGADATRFGLIWQSLGNQDIHWSEEHVLAGKKFCNKIWNATRFVLQNVKSKIKNQKSKLQAKNQNLTEADKKILGGLKKTRKEADALIEKYEFGRALHLLYDFFWHEYADIYIETAKRQMADKKLKGATQAVLVKVHSDLLKMLHPFLPFITEELWGAFGGFSGSKNLLLVESWPN
mgnify:CR=1 FL=1